MTGKVKIKAGYCVGCNDALESHVKNLNDDIICVEVHSGTTTGGLYHSYTNRCDCINAVSERTERERERELKELERWSK